MTDDTEWKGKDRSGRNDNNIFPFLKFVLKLDFVPKLCSWILNKNTNHLQKAWANKSNCLIEENILFRKPYNTVQKSLPSQELLLKKIMSSV